jgi:hypothetical protein
MGILLACGAAAVLALALVPARLLGRAQDRLAQRLLAGAGAEYKLLTRAELGAPGRHRRLPGVLGLTGDAVVFQGLFGETEVVPTARLEKIVTGTRRADGRRLVGREVLRLTRTGGTELEFILSPASASAWRSHLGLWAVEERRAALDLVSPGKK